MICHGMACSSTTKMPLTAPPKQAALPCTLSAARARISHFVILKTIYMTDCTTPTCEMRPATRLPALVVTAGASSAPRVRGHVLARSGRYLDDTFRVDTDDLVAQSSRRRNAIVRRLLSARAAPLQVFGLYIGRNELYDVLWELDLTDMVTFATKLEEADCVLHRRAAPGERQVQVKQWRAAARARGIPFVSLSAPTVPELHKSILQVLQAQQGRTRQ